MLITLAVIFIVLATFALIVVNMISDYTSRRDQDYRTMVNHARNIISDTEELLLNQAQISMSKVLLLVLHNRILRCLEKMSGLQREGISNANVKERLLNEKKIIAEIKSSFHDELAFRPPETDGLALAQLRCIRRLRTILHSEMKIGTIVSTSEIQAGDRRLYLLVLKVNISNLISRTLELKRLKQIGSCRVLVQKGLDVIRKSNIKDEWINEKADLLMQLESGLNEEKRDKLKELALDAGRQAEAKKDMDELFGDKKKW